MPKFHRIAHLIALILVSLGFAQSAGAGYLPMPIGLSSSVAKSEAIALCKIDAMTPDAAASRPARITWPITNARVAVEYSAIQPTGNYSFTVIRAIKGSLPQNLQIQLPFVSPYYYGDKAFKRDKQFKVQPGIYCILMLSKEGDHDWVPVDPTVPLIPMGDALKVPTDLNSNPQSAVVSLILKTLDDPDLRLADACMLQKARGPDVLRALKSLASDSDDRVKAYALGSMAFNQDISAIPLIIELSKKPGCSACADALEDYQNEDAVPALNAALDSAADYARVCAARALRRLADDSSIPYLLRALPGSRDDPQHFVSYEAYRTLHRLIRPAVPGPFDRAYFLGHRGLEIDKLISWLRDHPRN